MVPNQFFSTDFYTNFSIVFPIIFLTVRVYLTNFFEPIFWLFFWNFLKNVKLIYLMILLDNILSAKFLMISFSYPTWVKQITRELCGHGLLVKKCWWWHPFSFKVSILRVESLHQFIVWLFPGLLKHTYIKQLLNKQNLIKIRNSTLKFIELTKMF